MSEFEERQISFEDGRVVLSGLLIMPTGRKPHAAIILVHGSGGADRNSGGYFVDLRKHFALSGYAVLCYDKPGIGLSTGDWTKQSFEDRAIETQAALHFLDSIPELEDVPRGFWGGSQAGWIMPMVASDVRFMISVAGAAVISHEQEAFRIEKMMQVDGFSTADIGQAVDVYHRRVQMIRDGESLESVHAAQLSASEDAWASYLGCDTVDVMEFFAKNLEFDPLPYWQKVTCPVLAIWGEADLYVPVDESLKRLTIALAEAGNDQFEHKIFPRANHGIGKIETGTSKEKWIGFADGYFELMTTWLDNLLAQPAIT